MEKRKILIVDDDEVFSNLLKMRLEKTNRFDIKVENKGCSGLAAAKEFSPDLVLLDIMMPDKDGAAVACQLKEDDVTKDIPVIFLTSMVTKKEVTGQGSNVGNYPIMAKEAETEEIVAAIEKNISK